MSERDIILVYGKTGMGKTAWSIRYLRGQKRVIVLDPLGKIPCQYFDDLEELADHTMNNRVFRVGSEYVPDFPSLCAVCKVVKDNTFVIEESQRVIPPRTDLDPAFEDLIYRGRHDRVSILAIAQRPSTVHIALRSQFTRLIVFRQTEVSDLRWIEQVTGEDLALSELAILEYYDITPNGVEKKSFDIADKVVV